MKTLDALVAFLEASDHAANLIEDVSSSARKRADKTVQKIGAPATSVSGLKPPWLPKHFKERSAAKKGKRESRFATSFRHSLGQAQDVAQQQHGMHLGPSLGTGTSGAAFEHAKHKGTVVKFEKGDRESKLARYAMSSKQLKKNSILPKYHKVVNTGVKDDETGEHVHALHREDLSDIQTKNHVPWHHYGRAVSDTAERLAKGGKTHHDFHELKDELDSHHRKFRGDVHPKERQKYDRFHTGMQKLLRHGIVPCDMHAGNLGSRKNGEVVVRDAGCHHRVQFHNNR
jgi:hypothetical protein